MDLVLTPDNPAPQPGQVLSVTTSDGLAIRVVRWPARVAEPRGTVILIQGRAEFIEKYFETANDLLARGFAVVSFDWRGQGGSTRELGNRSKGHVDDFALYALDLEAVLDQAIPADWSRPLFAIAHSMGGAILLSLLGEGFSRFERVVVTAPMVKIAFIGAQRLVRSLAEGLDAIGLGTAFVPGGGAQSISAKPFVGNHLTGDSVRYARNAAVVTQGPKVGIGDPTVSWLNAAFRCMSALQDPRLPAAITTPVLVIGAGDDAVVSTAAVERFAAYLKTGHAIVLPGALHEVLMERDPIRQAFLAAFDAFIPGSPPVLTAVEPVVLPAGEREAAG